MAYCSIKAGEGSALPLHAVKLESPASSTTTSAKTGRWSEP
jgi:hypothetical protein